MADVTAVPAGGPCPECGYRPDTPNHVYGCITASPVPAVPEDQPTGCDHVRWRLLDDGDMECLGCGSIEDQGDDDDAPVSAVPGTTQPADDEKCPQGRTDYEACFAPFRYCPVKGCNRPTPYTYEEFGDDAPALRLRDMGKRWAEHRTNPHYSGVTTCAHGEELHVGWLELADDTEAAHALLDWIKVPDGLPQGGGDIDTRVAKAVLRLVKAESALATVAQHHEQGNLGGGIVSGYCVECERVWPCPTYSVANGDRDPNTQPWNPVDDGDVATEAIS